MKSQDRQDAAFFGKITAGATHELKNILAIIKETTGLIEDLLQMPEHRSEFLQERFEKLFPSINQQIKRGHILLSSLNRFAHSGDDPGEDTDLFAAAENLSILCKHILRLKSASIVLQPVGKSVSARIQRFRFQMALKRLLSG
ncbi:MAG: hypothetical protein HQ517_01245 [SAR324 cluster bacterium]|nr:hypothetical protein [SAR324 cluster bacterium]